MAIRFKWQPSKRITCLKAAEKPSLIGMERMQPPGRVMAVLGPTNTGKTHLAVERMLGHASGIIGCPLRLLAREIYEKVVAVRGASTVALVTGEEKIVPLRPRYYVCTTEAMPRDLTVEFVGIDEIQLAADPERGHVFTDRLLHTRGLAETMFLGAATITPLLRILVPRIEFISRPRFSDLRYSGERKITRLQSRSAIVAFSASDVYMLAESIRSLRGGAAVVLGALSPRTRNKQVGMFQAGEVDYLIATDAIGMGLNLDVNHVAFAKLRKFDGRKPRNLTAAEIAQIAGRAGRHMRDGTFGTTADAGSLHPDTVAAIEQHTFPAITTIYWRNSQLDFKSLENLLHSLELEPPSPQLMRPREAEDLVSLRTLITNPDVLARANGYAAISLLWEVCSIPDFRKILTDEHVKLLTKIYLYLSGPSACLPNDWVHQMASRLDQTEGDIDTLAARIAHIRTWNYVAHRPEWMADPVSLQEQTRAIEDRLSDALHERLTQRFVDRRAAVLVKGFNSGQDVPISMKSDGEIDIAGELIGRLQGLDFIPNGPPEQLQTGTIKRAVHHALAPKIKAHVSALGKAHDETFDLAPNSTIIWSGGPVGRLLPGSSALQPKVIPVTGEMLDGHMRRLVRRRLESWITNHIGKHFAPLLNALDAPVSGPVRGIAFRLLEGLGNTERRQSAELIRMLSDEDRKSLARLGIRLGQINLFMPAMLKARPIALRAQLWGVHHKSGHGAPPPGRVSLPVSANVPKSYYPAVGYQTVGSLSVRGDILERLAASLRHHARRGPFSPDPELLSLCGAQPDEFAGILDSLGYRLSEMSNRSQDKTESGKSLLYVHTSKRSKRKKKKLKDKNVKHASVSRSSSSPFDALQSLNLSTK